MNRTSYMGLSILAALIIVLAIAVNTAVQAQVSPTDPDTENQDTATATEQIDQVTDQGTSTETIPAPIVLEIGNQGDVLIRGIATEISADTFTIESWGGNWTISIAEDTAIIAGGSQTASDLSGISDGDLVGVEGMISDDNSTIEAALIRNWTTDPLSGVFERGVFTNPMITMTQAFSSDTEQSAEDTQGTGTEVSSDTAALGTNDEDDEDATDDGADDEDATELLVGTVDEIGDNELVFTDQDDTTYTVDLDGDVTLENEDGETITTDDIDEGDDVTVEGSVDGTNITPSTIIVDTSWLSL